MKITPNTIRICLILPSVLVLNAVAILVSPKTALCLTPSILLRFGANYAPYTLGLNQYWRLITAGFVHRGPIHFGLNTWALFMLTPMLCGLVGTGRCVIVFLLAIIGGSLASLLWDPTLISFGASGGIFGMLGCYAACSFLLKKLGAPQQQNFSGIRAFFVVGYCLLLGIMTPGTDNANHLGGLVTGALLGLWCGFVMTKKPYSLRLSTISLMPCILLLVCLFAWEKVALGSGNKLQILAEQQKAEDFASEHKYAEALRILDQAIEKNPQEISLRAARIPVLIQLKMYKAVIVDANIVLSQKNNDTIALLSRSIAHHNLGEDKEAVADLEKLIKIDPHKPLAYNNMAWSLIAIGQNDRAMKCLNDALAINPQLATVHDTKAVLLTHTGNYQYALNELDKAIALDKTDGAAYYHRAVVLAVLGKDDEALVESRKAQQLGYKPEPWEVAWKANL